MALPFDIAAVRAQFPSLDAHDNGKQRVYFDAPAGTQVPQQVIDRTVETFTKRNANLGGYFATSISADELVTQAHQAVADFYNASGPDEIIFGQNMTSLTLQISRCLGKRFKAGDEIILSRMEHEANVAPWLLLAEDLGLVVRWLDFDPESFEFSADALSALLTKRTKLLAMGLASNCTGTVNDVKHFAHQAHHAGALVFVDAVQFAPHYAIDVQDLGADFLVSSAYKWFGPHQAALWAKRELLAEMFAYKVRAVGDELPHKFETGTLSHEGMAGCLGAIEYLQQFGQGASQRQRLVSAWDHLVGYEHGLTRSLLSSLHSIKGLKVHGITSANALHRRVPTVSVTIQGHRPEALAKALAGENMFTWSGHNYALEPVRRLGLMEGGGVLRIGLSHYNTVGEIDGLVTALDRIIGKTP